MQDNQNGIIVPTSTMMYIGIASVVLNILFLILSFVNVNAAKAEIRTIELEVVEKLIGAEDALSQVKMTQLEMSKNTANVIKESNAQIAKVFNTLIKENNLKIPNLTEPPTPTPQNTPNPTVTDATPNTASE
jgi:hypothetical protein